MEKKGNICIYVLHSLLLSFLSLKKEDGKHGQ